MYSSKILSITVYRKISNFSSLKHNKILKLNNSNSIVEKLQRCGDKGVVSAMHPQPPNSSCLQAAVLIFISIF